MRRRGTIHRYNKRKSQRNPPAAIISNNCNPTTSISIDRRFFFNYVYDTALSNGWIKYPNSYIPVAPPEQEKGIYYSSKVYNIAATEYSFVFPDDGVFAVKFSMRDSTTGVKTYIAVNYVDAPQKYIEISDNNVQPDLYIVYISPQYLNAVGYDASSPNSLSTFEEPVQSFIRSIAITNGTFERDSIVATMVSLVNV